MDTLLLKCFVLLVIGLVVSVNGFYIKEMHYDWIARAVKHIRRNAKAPVDVVFPHNPSSEDEMWSTLDSLRRFLRRETIVKIESLKSDIEPRRRAIYFLDGTNFRKLQMSIQQIHQKRSTLADKLFEYYFVISTTTLTPSHQLLFKMPLSCHMIFIHMTKGELTIHRISAANSGHVRTFNASAPLEWIFDDRQDWHGYNVNILAEIQDALIGVDIETCKAIFNHGNMSYNFAILQEQDYHELMEQLLRRGSIHLVVSRSVLITSPYGEHLFIRDTDGMCLVVPQRHQRNFIYHLVQPFELNTWIVIAVILVLDMILAAYFPIAFPHNPIMILLFGAGHGQTRWTRFYCFGCTVFLVILSGAYLGNAITHMTLTRYDPGIKTVAEFVASDIPILIGTETVPHLNSSEVMSELLSETIQVPNFDFHLNSSRYAYLVPCNFGRQLIDWQVIENQMKHGREAIPRFYLVDEGIMWHFKQMVFHYQFMYYARFQLALSWLGEGGLWDKWTGDVQKRYDHQNMQYELRDVDDILFLEDLAAVWYLVAGGWIISGMTFMLEVVINFLKAKLYGKISIGKLCFTKK